MPHSPETDNYFARIENFICDENVTTDGAKKLLIDILSRMKDLERFKLQAKGTIAQYEDVISIVDCVLDRERVENLDDRRYPVSALSIRLLNSVNDFLIWFFLLTEELKGYKFEEYEMNFLVSDMNNMLRRMLRTSYYGMKKFQKYVPTAEALETWIKGGKLDHVEHMNQSECEDKENENTLQENDAESDKDSSESTFEDRDAIQNDGVQYSEDGSKSTFNDRNTLHNNSAQRGEEPVKSALDDQNTLKNHGTRCKEKPDMSDMELSTSSSKNDINEGGKSEYVRNEVAYERSEIKVKKIFKVISDEETAEQVTAKLKDICQNISTKSRESPCNSTLNQLKRIYKRNTNREESETVQNARGISTSKGRCSSKRKCALDTNESYINEDGMDENKSGTSQNFVCMPKRKRLGRNHYSDTHETNVNGIGKKKINTLQNFMSKRSCRSNKYNSLSAHENDLSENNSRRIRNKSKANLSETKTEDEILHVNSKEQRALNQRNQNRKGRNKRNVMHQQKINENFKSSDKGENVLSLKVVPHCACSSLNTGNMPQQEINENSKSSDKDKNVPSLKVVPHCACSSLNTGNWLEVKLSDVLLDPEVQHYNDVIKCKRKKKESIARCKEKNEIDEVAICEDRNEMEQESWNVVDAVSDEEDKAYNNIEDIVRLSNNDNLESNSDVDKENIVSDADREQLENVDSDRELDDSSYRKELDENHDAEHNDNSSSSFDSETKEFKKGPSTPDAPPPESDFDHSEDENDADSVKSEDDIGSTKSFTSDDHQSNGSKESQLSPQSDESEVVAVTDDEESYSSE